MNNDDCIEKTKRIILSSRYLTIATSDGTVPWIATLTYAVQSDYSFVYHSAIEARHSQHIAKNSLVACTIFDSEADLEDADSVQFSGTVSEVPADDLEQIARLYFVQCFPDDEERQRWLRPVDDFKAPGAQRFYRIVPSELYTLDRTTETANRRIQVDLEALRNHVSK